MHPDDRSAGSAVLTELMTGERDQYEIQHRIVRPDGAIRHVVSRGEVIDRDDEGHPTRVGGMLQDVTESVAAAERLARSEAHLSGAQRIASIGSWAWEIDTGQIEWSVEFSRVLGLPEDTVQGLDVFFASVHPADGERIQLSVAACVEASAPIDVVCRVIRPDGTIRVIHSHGDPVAKDGTGRATRYLGAVQDVTEQVAREDRLRASEERNRRLAAEQAALRRVATSVATGATPEAIFGQVAAEVGALLDVRAGVVWRFEGDRSVAVGSWGHRRSQVGVAFSLAGDGAVPLAWRTGRAATVNYPSLAANDPTAARVRPQGYRSGVAAPIAINGRPWGAVLAATSEVRVFSDEEKHGLERFADLVGLAIANADARSRLVARAASDPLTGLANHRTVHETIRREVARAHRHKRSLAVALFDLDHFKEVNDIHGHQVGDRRARGDREHPAGDRPRRATSWGASGARSSCGSCPRPTRWARTTPPSGSARWWDRASRRRASRSRSRRASATWSRRAPRRSSWPSPTAPSTGPRPTGATSPSSTRPRSSRRSRRTTAPTASSGPGS